MEIIDAQIHEFGPYLSSWPSDVPAQTRDAVTQELTYASMESAGIDGAVLHPVGSLDWACAMAERDPDRFVVVPMVGRMTIPGVGFMLNPDEPDFTNVLSNVLSRSGVRAIRVIGGDANEFNRGDLDEAFDLYAGQRIPVFLNVVGHVEVAAIAARRFSDVTIIIDHLGMPAPPQQPDAPWWKALDTVLSLSIYPNIQMKLSAVPAHSRTGYPFADLRPQLELLLAAFGADRIMWGSDISRLHGRMGWDMHFPELQSLYPGRHSYAESVNFLKYADWISIDDRKNLLGGTARKSLNWPRSVPQSA